jgi:hypothetical protein
MPDNKLSKSWPYDPEKLSYKEWIALPSDEQDDVLKFLDRRTQERIARDGPLRGKAYEDSQVQYKRLLREVVAEQERTGRIRPGWILMGEGVVVHHLIRQLPPGMKWVEPVPPRRKEPSSE